MDGLRAACALRAIQKPHYPSRTPKQPHASTLTLKPAHNKVYSAPQAQGRTLNRSLVHH